MYRGVFFAPVIDMKRFVVVLLMFLPLLKISAQVFVAPDVVLVNRIDAQYGNATKPFDAIVAQSPTQSTQSVSSLQVKITQTRLDFADADGGGEFLGSIKNISTEIIRFNFFRKQFLPTPNWSSTICLNVCYQPGTDSLPESSLVEIAPGEVVPFIFHVYTTDIHSTDSLIAFIKFENVGKTPPDTVSYTFIAKSNSDLSTVNDKSFSSTNPSKISSIYPSPLVEGSAIKVSIQSPRETGISYSIFDAFGREVAFGSSAHKLSAGFNTLEIKSLDGLASGSYVLRINFVGGGSDARTFQVIN